VGGATIWADGSHDPLRPALQVGAVCQDQGLGRDSSLEVFMAPGILDLSHPAAPPGVYLGGFEPGGNSFDPAGQALQRVGEVDLAVLGGFLELAAGRVQLLLALLQLVGQQQ
jgi:hypothetical protein